MSIIKKVILLVLLIAPAVSKGKGENEFSVLLKNGILLNKANNKSLYGDKKYTDIKNTFQQSLGVNYTRVTSYGFLIAVGVDAGYERYVAKINYPFEEWGYERPSIARSQYSRNVTVPFAQLNVGIGYRVKAIKTIQPEIRLGHIFHLAFKSERFDDWVYEKSAIGWPMNNVTSYGYYGKYDPGVFGVEMITYAYAGVSIKPKMKLIHKVSIGLQYQRQMIFANNPLNYHKVTYYDAYGFTRAIDEFRGKHSSINLMLGVTF